MAGNEFIAYSVQSGLGSPRFLFSATPYEGGAANNNVVYSYDSQGRRDMRYLGSATTGNGWQHNFEIVGKKYRRDTVWGGRAAGVRFTQYANTNVDPLDGGFLDLGYSTDTAHLYGIIKDDSGVNTQFLAPGIQRTQLVATTPDYFLAKQRTPRLPYLLAAIAAKERAKWGTLKHTIADLGFMPTTGEDSTLGFDKDSLAGFGAYFDEASGSYTDVMSPHPANEVHFLGSLSAAYALKEYFANHVRMNGSPIGQTMGIEITPDGESAIITLDIAEGSPHNAALSTLREGNYRYWWDYNSGMHLIPDYCTPFYGGASSYGTLNLSMIAGLTIEVSPGPPVGYPRVNRVYAEGQWTSPAATGDPLGQVPSLEAWKNAPNKATYPPGQGIGLGGEDVSIKGAHITQTATFVHAEYNRLSQRDRVKISGFPYVNWAIRAYNRVVKLTFPADPLGSFGGVTEGYYSVESVQIDAQNVDEMGGCMPECSLEFLEIISTT